MRDRKNAPDFPRNRPVVLVASEVHVQQQAEEKPKSSFSGSGKSRQFFYLQWQSKSYLFSPEIKRQQIGSKRTTRNIGMSPGGLA